MKRYLPSLPSCFGCSKENPRGIRLLIFEEDCRVQAEFKPSSGLSGFPGIVHGGISCTLLDEIMWWAAFAYSGKPVITGEISVKLFKPLLQEGSYNISAEIIKKERKHLAARGFIKDKDDIFCQSSGKYFYLRSQQAEKLIKPLKYQDAQGRIIPPELRYNI